MKSGLTLDLPQPPGKGRLWVAYSGGLDSTVLLHRLAAEYRRRLHAVHIHHGLQAAADDWVRHCRANCRALRVPLTVVKVKVDAGHAEGPEAAAREARYAAFKALMRKGDVLLTAHHQDDQAETVLLRLLRGAGLAGLSAMAEDRPFGPGRLWRPVLNIPRAQLLAYAHSQALRWIEDPHNQSERYARSYLRAEVLPRLARHWPQAAASLARTARLAGEAQEVLDERAAEDLAAVSVPGGALSRAGLQALSTPRRNNLLRHWLSQQGWQAPSAETLARVQGEVLEARADAQPVLNGGDYEFRRYRDQLFVMAPLPPPPGPGELAWTRGTLRLPAGCGALKSRKPLPKGLRVCFGRTGASLRLGAHSRSLKNLFQEAGVPPWVRVRMPLIYREGRLVAVGDRWTAADAGLSLVWTRDLPGAGAAQD